MFNLLKEYITLKIKEASFQDILNQIKDENENEDKNNSVEKQSDIKSKPDTNDLKILKNMSIPHNRFKNDQKQTS